MPVDDALQRLLETEKRAEELARQANLERERIIREALEEARREEGQFEARIPEIHASFVDKADARAEQTVNELRKRFDERHLRLRQQAEEREGDALQAALQLIVDPKL
jgi:V/A-type H+-transporting ATPase subunit G/H